MSNFLKYTIAILVIAAVFLGYQVYQSQAPTEKVVTPISTTNTNTAPTGTVDVTPKPVTTTTTTTTTTTSPATTAEVKALLTTPSSTATKAEQDAYAKLVIDSAVNTSSINISSCIAQPTVASFADKSNVTLVNGDSVDHRVDFNETTFFVVPAKSSKSISANFGKGPGIYGYGCDGSQKAVGMVFVTTP